MIKCEYPSENFIPAITKLSKRKCMIENAYSKITTRRMECPRSVVLFITRILNQIKHFINTKFGILEEYVHTSKELNLGGRDKATKGAIC